jgi:hypothetical protein
MASAVPEPASWAVLAGLSAEDLSAGLAVRIAKRISPAKLNAYHDVLQ